MQLLQAKAEGKFPSATLDGARDGGVFLAQIKSRTLDEEGQGAIFRMWEAEFLSKQCCLPDSLVLWKSKTHHVQPPQEYGLDVHKAHPGFLWAAQSLQALAGPERQGVPGGTSCRGSGSVRA